MKGDMAHSKEGIVLPIQFSGSFTTTENDQNSRLVQPKAFDIIFIFDAHMFFNTKKNVQSLREIGFVEFNILKEIEVV